MSPASAMLDLNGAGVVMLGPLMPLTWHNPQEPAMLGVRLLPSVYETPPLFSGTPVCRHCRQILNVVTPQVSAVRLATPPDPSISIQTPETENLHDQTCCNHFKEPLKDHVLSFSHYILRPPSYHRTKVPKPSRHY